MEFGQFDRDVTISRLPWGTIVLVFMPSGLLVRTLVKDDPSVFLPGDVQNESSRTVAAGIYVAYIDIPDLGVKKNLKLAVLPTR